MSESRMAKQIYGHRLQNNESVVCNFERGSPDPPDTSNGVAESIYFFVIVNGFFEVNLAFPIRSTGVLPWALPDNRKN